MVVHALVQLGVMSGGDFRAGVQRNSRLNDNIIIDDNTLIDNNIKLVSAGLKSKIKRDNGSPEMHEATAREVSLRMSEESGGGDIADFSVTNHDRL